MKLLLCRDDCLPEREAASTGSTGAAADFIFDPIVFGLLMV
jgi:hypothetical protein